MTLDKPNLARPDPISPPDERIILNPSFRGAKWAF